MTIFFKKIILFFVMMVLFVASAYPNISIHIMQNSLVKAVQQKGNIAATVKQALINAHIDTGSHSPYGAANVELLQDNHSRYLLVHLMSRYFLSYEILRINLNADGSVQYPIIRHYKMQSANFLMKSGVLRDSVPICPAEYQTGKPLFVIASPAYTDERSVNRSINALRQAVLGAGQYQLVQLLDDDATVQNYQNILACTNLKYFAHFGGSDDYGQSFALVDGDFDASYFLQNPQLNLSDKAISLDSCNLFDQVDQGFCPIFKAMSQGPAAYTTGSSQLLIWGSAETYACFWEKVLHGEPMTQSTLQQCAIDYDPSVLHSQSGIYFIGSRDDANKVVIQTNQRVISVDPSDYTVLKLMNGEQVTQYGMVNSRGQNIICTPDPINRITLLNNATLTSGEFILNNANDNACQFTEISRMVRNGNITRDIYGFSPKEACFHLPNRPPVGDVTLSSNAGPVNIICNGAESLPIRINNSPVVYSWQTLVDQYFNHSENVACTFNLDSTKVEIASMNINIRISSTLPGQLAAKISNVKTMNYYPSPTFSYSGKGDVAGYHNGIAIVINPVVPGA